MASSRLSVLLPFLFTVQALPICMSDAELMGEVAAALLFEQAFVAAQCDAAQQVDEGSAAVPLSALHRAFLEKFDARLAPLRDARIGLFQRLYGDRWEDNLAEERRGKTSYFLRNLAVTPTQCEALSVRLILRVNGGWGPVGEELAKTFTAARRKVLACP